MTHEFRIKSLDKIALRTTTEKIVIVLFALFLQGMGLGLMLLFFSFDITSFFPVATFSFFAILFVISFGYVAIYPPDGTTNIKIKPYLGIILLITVSMGGYSYIHGLFNHPAAVIGIIFYALFAITAWIFVIFFIVKQGVVFLDAENKRIIHVQDYRTQQKEKSVPLNEISYVKFKNTMEGGKSAGSVSIFFYKNDITTVANGNLVKTEVKPDYSFIFTSTYNTANIFYGIITFLSQFPIKVECLGAVSFYPFKGVIGKPLNLTFADFSKNNLETILDTTIKATESKILVPSAATADAPASTSPFYNDDSSVIEALRKEFHVIRMNSHHWLLRAKKHGVDSRQLKILTLIKFLIVGAISFPWIIGLMEILTGRPLLTAFYSKPEAMTLPLILFATVLFLLLSPFTLWLGIVTFLTTNELVVEKSVCLYSMKIFNFTMFKRIFPKKAIIDIEIKSNQILLRLLGGDAIKMWKGPIKDMKYPLIAFKHIFLSPSTT